MAVLRVEFDNILCFKNFVADFTYPKKIVKSPLEGEFLSKFPNIRYKKVNIIIGSNASGKTSLGRAIWKTLLFINNKESTPFRHLVTNSKKDARVLIDHIYEDGYFYRFEALIKKSGDILVRYRYIYAKANDTYASLINRLDDTVQFGNYITSMPDRFPGGWNIAMPYSENGFDIINCHYKGEEKKEFLSIYERLLKSFDSSIKEVNISKEQADTFIVKFYNGATESVTHGKKISELTKMSSGTRAVIRIAGLIYSMKKNRHGFYYADELFSFVNSDLEIACLTTMIECLGDGEQLFFTTHNEEVMNVSLPMHSFSFLKKVRMDDDFNVELINASSFERRNNVSVKNLYDNDYFDIAPDTKNVYEVLS